MSRTRPPYPADFRQQMVDLVRSGRSPEELARESRFRTPDEARLAVFEYIEGWYKPHRRHSAIGYQSPIRYERQYEQASTPKPETVH